MKRQNKGRAALLALLAALVWGLAFSGQRVAASYLGPFSFNMFRSTLAGLALGVPTLVRAKKGARLWEPGRGKSALLGGVVCGCLLCAASTLQQKGIETTSASMAGFITALYIVLVPVLEVVFLRKKVAPLLWVSVAAAAVGLYFICVAPGGFSVGRGELLVIMCALIFSVHILVVEHAVSGVDPVLLSCIQFWTFAVLSALGVLLFRETPSLSALGACLGAVAYVGVVSGAGGYTLQMAAQKEGSTVVVSLLLSMESVFSLLGGALLLHEQLTPRQLLGCGIMLAAVILSQLVGVNQSDG